MNEIRIVDGSYAVVRDNRVIGVVQRCCGRGWSFRPLVDGPNNGLSYIPLDHALREALTFRPSP